jgi:lysophospholipase L1-like esterase
VKESATQGSIDKGWMSRATIAMTRGARMRGLGSRVRAVTAVAVLVAASGACGGDDSSTPEPGPTGTPSVPMSMTPPAANPTPVTPAENPAPSTTPPGAAAESPPGSVPLENPPPSDGDGSDGAAEGEEPPASDSEEPPASDGESPPPEPTPEPEESPAFNPCPTDGSPCRIMPLGDSITFGFIPNSGQSNGGYRVELFRQAVLDDRNITFVGTNPRGANGPNEVEGQPFPRDNEGISGDTIPGVAGRVDAALAATQPDIVLLHIGTNHLYGGLPANIPGQLADLLDQITETAPDALVVVAQITPLTGPNNGVEEYNATIPAMVEERVDEGKHLMLLDIFTPFSASGSLAQRLPDSVHPDVEGYAVMGRTWYEAIESFLP